MNFFRKLFEAFVNREEPRTEVRLETKTCNRNYQVAPYGACEMNFERLRQEGISYHTTRKVPYHADKFFKSGTVETVFDFAYQMTFGRAGAHRDHRSGGTHARRNGEIFANTFQGKLAECAVSNFFHQLGYDVSPDFATYDLGRWDSVDLSVGGYEISIKSTKRFGQLLLLETHDWDENGTYIPNKETGNGDYDIIIFVRLDPSCEDILRDARLITQDRADYNSLANMILKQQWSYNCVGYITRDDLRYIIENEYIIPRNAMLNGRVRMDADNYYVQAGDMRDMKTLEDLFK